MTTMSLVDGPAVPSAPPAPSAEQWREAFLAMEAALNRIDNMAKVAEYLTAELLDEADDKAARVKLGFYNLAEITCRAAFNLIDAAREAEKAFYEAHNDLIARENAFLAAQPQRTTGGARNG